MLLLRMVWAFHLSVDFSRELLCIALGLCEGYCRLIQSISSIQSPDITLQCILCRS